MERTGTAAGVSVARGTDGTDLGSSAGADRLLRVLLRGKRIFLATWLAAVALGVVAAWFMPERNQYFTVIDVGNLPVAEQAYGIAPEEPGALAVRIDRSLIPRALSELRAAGIEGFSGVWRDVSVPPGAGFVILRTRGRAEDGPTHAAFHEKVASFALGEMNDRLAAVRSTLLAERAALAGAIARIGQMGAAPSQAGPARQDDGLGTGDIRGTVQQAAPPSGGPKAGGAEGPTAHGVSPTGASATEAPAVAARAIEALGEVGSDWGLGTLNARLEQTELRLVLLRPMQVLNGPAAVERPAGPSKGLIFMMARTVGLLGALGLVYASDLVRRWQSAQDQK